MSFDRIVLLMCKKPNARIYGYRAAAPPFRQLLLQPVKTTLPKLRSLYLEVNSVRPSGDISVFIVGSFQMRRSVSKAGWQLLRPCNERNSRIVPTG